jgi:hypothetical protein
VPFSNLPIVLIRSAVAWIAASSASKADGGGYSAAMKDEPALMHFSLRCFETATMIQSNLVKDHTRNKTRHVFATQNASEVRLAYARQ